VKFYPASASVPLHLGSVSSWWSFGMSAKYSLIMLKKTLQALGTSFSRDPV